jgi:hypothetical protein
VARPEGIEPSFADLESTSLPQLGRVALRTGIGPVSTARQAACDTSRITQHSRPRKESDLRSRLRRPAAGSAGEDIRVTYGYRSRQRRVHSAPGSPAPSRHGRGGPNRTGEVLFPKQASGHRSPPRWTPWVSRPALALFRRAPSLDRLGVRQHRVRVSNPSGEGENLATSRKSNAACFGRQLLWLRLPGIELEAGIEPASPQYESGAAPCRPLEQKLGAADVPSAGTPRRERAPAPGSRSWIRTKDVLSHARLTAV